MVPAEFQAADDVLPEVILHGFGEGKRFLSHSGDSVGGREILALGEVFHASVEAQFVGGLDEQIGVGSALVARRWNSNGLVGQIVRSEERRAGKECRSRW